MGASASYFIEGWLDRAAHPKEVDNLCEQLSAFHISTRMRKIAGREEEKRKRDEQLPSPWFGERPCWEPPMLDYGWFEQFLEAEEEMARRKGSEDIAFRTEINDLLLERKLLQEYSRDATDKERKARFLTPEWHFWHGLYLAIGQERGDLEIELNYEVHTRHGKTVEDWDRMVSSIMDIAQEKDANFDRMRFLWASARWG